LRFRKQDDNNCRQIGNNNIIMSCLIWTAVVVHFYRLKWDMSYQSWMWYEHATKQR